jgi:hypothetical protein
MWKTTRCRNILPPSSGQKMAAISARQPQSFTHSKNVRPTTRLCGDVPSKDNDMNTNPLFVQLPVKILQCNQLIDSCFTEYTSLYMPTHTCVVRVSQCTSKSTDSTEIYTPLYTANLVKKKKTFYKNL